MLQRNPSSLAITTVGGFLRLWIIFFHFFVRTQGSKVQKLLWDPSDVSLVFRASMNFLLNMISLAAFVGLLILFFCCRHPPRVPSKKEDPNQHLQEVICRKCQEADAADGDSAAGAPFSCVAREYQAESTKSGSGNVGAGSYAAKLQSDIMTPELRRLQSKEARSNGYVASAASGGQAARKMSEEARRFHRRCSVCGTNFVR